MCWVATSARETCFRPNAPRLIAAAIKALDFCVRIGDPGSEIAAFGEGIKAELIVMPSHGRTGLNKGAGA